MAGSNMKVAALLMFVTAGLSGVAFADGPGAYLKSDTLNLSTLLPAPPRTGSEREADDRRIFRETRALVGTPRWQEAIADTDESTPSLLGKFSCAAGRDLTGKLPHMKAVLERAAATGAELNDRAKQIFRRPRPFTMEDGPTCQDKAVLSRNYDYPSGHAARGWMWAFVLSELFPERAQAIMMRAKEFGQSRVVCGAHSQSAVNASTISSSMTFARLQGDRVFLAELERARKELAKSSLSRPRLSCGPMNNEPFNIGMNGTDH